MNPDYAAYLASTQRPSSPPKKGHGGNDADALREATAALSLGTSTTSGSQSQSSDGVVNPNNKISELENIRRVLAAVKVNAKLSEGIVFPKESCRHSDGVPRIQSDVSSVMYQLGSFQDILDSADNVGYNQTHSSVALHNMLGCVAAANDMAEQGQEFVHMLYTYRSVSRALRTAKDSSSNGNSAEIQRRIVDVLRPEIRKLHDLHTYVIKAGEMFRHFVMKAFDVEDASFATSNLLQGIHSESLYLSLTRLLDVLMQIDALKAARQDALLADFTQYKLALLDSTRTGRGASDIGATNEENADMENFLNNSDAKRKQHFVFQVIVDELYRFAGNADTNTVETIIDMLMAVIGNLQNNFYVDPEEKFAYLRVLPYLVLLIDQLSVDDQIMQVKGPRNADKSPKSTWLSMMGKSIFNASATFLEPIQSFFLQYPFVPGIADSTLVLVTVLERSPRFKAKKVGVAWGMKPDARVVCNYDIGENWEQIRNDFSSYTSLFAQFCNSIDGDAWDATNTGFAKKAFDFTKQGLHYVTNWSCLLRQIMAWKYTHAAGASKLEGMGLKADTKVTDYEKAVRYNLSAETLSVFADVISMVKAMVRLLQQAESKFAPLLRFHCYHEVQHLIQCDLLPLTHRVDKRKHKELMPILLQIRSIAADWFDGSEPLENYKVLKRKHGVVETPLHTRAVSASATQLRLLRSYVRCLYSDTSANKLTYGVMGRKSDLLPTDVASLDNFYRTSRFFPAILTYSSVLADASNLSYMWYRESFLAREKHMVQFPIRMSLPWILTQHVGTAKGAKVGNIPLIEKLLFMLDIYNDAAQVALHKYGVQHIYNEIEAETNLVLDQLVYLLSEDIYNHHKNGASMASMEKSFRSKLEELKGSPYLTWITRRFDIPLAQRNVQILGRSVDLNFLIGRHLNDRLRHDLDCVLRRFESSSACGLPELQSALNIFRSVHEQLSKDIDLDPFCDMLAEVDETFASSTSVANRGRIASHVVFSIMCDILPNYAYNYYTQRFVVSPVLSPPKPCSYGRAPTRSSVDQLFGTVCGKAFERAGMLTRSFFGRVHMEALLHVLGYMEIPRLVDECLQILVDTLQDLTAYIQALSDHLPACNLPYSCNANAEHAHSYFHSQLAPLLEFDDLKPEVFQSLRYIGNALAFFKDLSAVLEMHDQFEFLSVAPLLGLVPDTNTQKAESAAVRSPLVKVLRNLSRAEATSIAAPKHKKNQKDAQVDPFVLQQLPAMAQRAIDVLASSLGSHNLFEAFLGRFHELFSKLELHEAWDLKEHQDVPDKFHVSAAFGFQRIWNTLLFLFCEQKAESGAILKESKTPFCSHEDEFGHGFFFAGVFLTHIMAHRTDYGLVNYGETVMRVHLECVAKDKLTQMQHVSSEKKDDARDVAPDASDLLSMPVSLFVDNVANSRQLMYEMSIYFQTLGERSKNAFHAHDAIDGVMPNNIHGGARHVIQLFHPPRDVPVV